MMTNYATSYLRVQVTDIQRVVGGDRIEGVAITDPSYRYVFEWDRESGFFCCVETGGHLIFIDGIYYLEISLDNDRPERATTPVRLSHIVVA